MIGATTKDHDGEKCEWDHMPLKGQTMEDSDPFYNTLLVDYYLTIYFTIDNN